MRKVVALVLRDQELLPRKKVTENAQVLKELHRRIELLEYVHSEEMWMRSCRKC